MWLFYINLNENAENMCRSLPHCTDITEIQVFLYRIKKDIVIVTHNIKKRLYGFFFIIMLSVVD